MLDLAEKQAFPMTPGNIITASVILYNKRLKCKLSPRPGARPEGWAGQLPAAPPPGKPCPRSTPPPNGGQDWPTNHPWPLPLAGPAPIAFHPPDQGRAGQPTSCVPSPLLAWSDWIQSGWAGWTPPMQEFVHWASCICINMGHKGFHQDKNFRMGMIFQEN
uniref:Uncharacterized protein n=1 Tax=Myotis myotis TaxID=51298 RepID=A0A7J7Z4S7_MYOMY|nr:hypothetical protein mMyoMyo1_010635 [Myotis myotis]